MILGLLAVVAACQQRQAVDGETDEARDAPAAAAPRETTATAVATTELAVTNAMPHEMIVAAAWGEPPQERVLGPVGPGETRSFEVAVPGGTPLVVTARDAGATHAVEGNVTARADSATGWTIE